MRHDLEQRIRYLRSMDLSALPQETLRSTVFYMLDLFHPLQELYAGVEEAVESALFFLESHIEHNPVPSLYQGM
jgi:hypothetical protein